jgi:DNA-binding response OmpR family regulator
MEKHEILLVDDDPNILEATGWALKDQGYQVTPATGGGTALELLNAKHFDLVMTDLNLGEGDGLVILRQVKERWPGTSVIIYTGDTDVAFAVEALRLGVDDYLLKPPDLTELRDRVAKCLQKPSPQGSSPLPP